MRAKSPVKQLLQHVFHRLAVLRRRRNGRIARLRRGREIVHEGKVATLKRFKDDANEVRAGLECGVKLDDFNGYQVGDVIECYDTQKVRASL